MPADRLQKILARAGFGSRRSAESLITDGRVMVNGATATLGQRADPAIERIEVDGRAVALPSAHVTIALHKPAGYVVTASDEASRQTVYDLLEDPPPGLRYVGRLDQYTEGLLLLTTDGELAHRLTHPRYHVEKVYEVTVEGVVPPAALEALRGGVTLEDGPTAPARVERLADEEPPTRVRLAIREGRKRQVRRMFDAVGHPVIRLVRASVGPITLDGLRRGASRTLSEREVEALRTAVGLDAADAATSDRR